MSPRRAAVHEFLPIAEFHDFHRDPNINFRLNRFLVPGLPAHDPGAAAKLDKAVSV
jgi:hypothetical protein